MTNPSGPPTAFDSLLIAGVPTMGISGLPVTNGNYWFVDSVSGSDGNTGAANNPFATLTQALSKCIAANGDVIVLAPGHAENVVAAGGINVNKSGVSIIGLGNGNNRPLFTFTTSTAATFLITAANVTISNIVATTTIDQIVSPFVVSAADCSLNIEWLDGSAVIEALRAILTTAAANRLNVNLRYIGFTAGSHGVNAIRLVGGRDARINVDYYGVLTTAVVEFFTTAVVDAVIQGFFYVSGVTNFSKSVVDTITGSTWAVSNAFDGAAGLSFDGGSGKALAGTDVTTVLANMNVPTTDSTANVLERDVVGSKADTGVTAVGTTKSIAAYVKGLITMLTVQSADSTNNAFEGDVIGNKTDAVLTAVGTTKSIMATVKTILQNVGFLADASVYTPGSASLQAYVKGASDIQEAVAVTAAAVITNGLALFTIAGGPIEILELLSICQTANGATASTLQYSSSGTLGATTQTISGASASLANAAAGTSVISQLTALATAPLVNANAANISASPGGVVVPAGSITAVVGVGSTTGTWTHFLRYRPLAKGVTVVNAF